MVAQGLEAGGAVKAHPRSSFLPGHTQAKGVCALLETEAPGATGSFGGQMCRTLWSLQLVVSCPGSAGRCLLAEKIENNQNIGVDGCFINLLTYFLAAGAISLGIGFLALSSALWFLICKRRELFRSPNIRSIDEKLKQRLYKRKAKPQSVFISRNFHTGQSQPQVEHREREAAQMKAVNSKDEFCLPDPVDGESPDMLSVENGSSVTVSFSTSIPSSYCSQSVEAADEWFSNDSLEAKTPPEPLLGEPLAEKVLAYLSSISLEEWPRNTMNVTFCGIRKDENTKEMFSQRNTEAGVHNLPCDIE
ncbi:uncharacterized protein C1orf185 homolog [Arvicola amphibius]|uniref:uncharacterized protein C1orf185 homolog n=1 Tax=Arvicola amphibius TaxID=1047088 RepID=UPI001C091583|nr:uncharacterized protein C1orf185 homolog [Arvicola amphibius]